MGSIHVNFIHVAQNHKYVFTVRTAITWIRITSIYRPSAQKAGKTLESLLFVTIGKLHDN